MKTMIDSWKETNKGKRRPRIQTILDMKMKKGVYEVMEVVKSFSNVALRRRMKGP